MGYREALERAGAKVLAFEEFGSYQGEWWAWVYYNGRYGWVSGSFGSCSECDSFESEFGDLSHKHGDGTRIYAHSDLNLVCPACIDLHERLAEFGQQYLSGLMTTEKALEVASRNLSWDTEADAMVAFIHKWSGDDNYYVCQWCEHENPDERVYCEHCGGPRY